MEFVMVMLQAFGESFLQPDISIFRQNLHALESLNSLHHLYSKVCALHAPVSLFLDHITQT